jgi:hypothetical protein
VQLFNPNGKTLTEIFFAHPTKKRVLIEEECSCTPGRLHYNIVYQETENEKIEEVLVLGCLDKPQSTLLMEMVSFGKVTLDQLI